MSIPGITLRCAFVNTLTDPDPLTWVDLSSRLRSFESDSGREDELKAFDVGSLVVELDNRDRALDRSNTSSPYSPNVQPLKRINLRATYGGSTVDLYTGFVEDWPFGETTPGKLSVKLRANDLLANLNATTFTKPPLTTLADGSPGPVEFAEHTGVRVGWLAQQAGLRIDDRLLDTGISSVGDLAWAESYNVLSEMRKAEAAETGQLFVRGDGKLIFMERYNRYNNYTTNLLTFGDGPGEYPPDADAVERESGAARVVNRALVKSANGTVFTAEDAGSQAQYLVRSWPSGGGVEDFGNNSDAEAEARANLMIARYSQPLERITAIETSGSFLSGVFWPVALQAAIGKRIEVKARYGGVGSILDQVSRIERIRWSGDTSGVIRVRYGLSPIPADELNAYWSLAAITSKLGTNTYLSF